MRKSSAQITDLYDAETAWQAGGRGGQFSQKQIGPIMSECLVTGFYQEDGAVVLIMPERPVKNGASLVTERQVMVCAMRPPVRRFLLRVKLALPALKLSDNPDWRRRDQLYLFRRQGPAPSLWQGFCPAQHPTGQTR